MEPLLVVISGSSCAKDVALRMGLEKQLHTLERQGLIVLWHAGLVRAGEPTHQVTLDKIRSARIIVPLLSPDYLSNDECENELRTTFARLAEARVMPVFLRPCTLTAPLQQMKLLPEGGAAVSTWTQVDDAWASVARSVREAANDLLNGRSHYVPVPRLPTAPMAPVSQRLDHARESMPSPVASNPRPSAVSIPPVVPVSARVPASSGSPPGVAPPAGAPPSASLPSAARHGAPRRGSAFQVIGLLLLGAALAMGLAKCSALLPETPLTQAPPSRADSPTAPTPKSTAPTTAPKEKAVCCGGVDCPEAERNVAGSFCEKNPAYCSRCPSGRARVEGACAESLPHPTGYHLRLGQALLGGNPVSARAQVCFRKSGTLDPLTCTTANEARAGKAPASTSLISVGTLAAGPGLDYEVRRDGATVASVKGARSKGGGILVGALCVGIVVHAPGSDVDSITVFLDP